eukprot:TRINITY_DN4685_c0_g1_i1.p1 TRINITY_DN4685_c0_g1~~TRINITY_DN4685_c0_g1_i1.p1  ORF type:complete len:367 (-),score=99.92 TRINITY_DN4685_c0_g1_i1:384-1388(-)
MCIRDSINAEYMGNQSTYYITIPKMKAALILLLVVTPTILTQVMNAHQAATEIPASQTTEHQATPVEPSPNPTNGADPSTEEATGTESGASRDIDLVIPIASSLSSQYKLEWASIQIDSSKGDLGQKFEDCTFMTQLNGRITIAGFYITDEIAKNIDRLLEADFGTEAFCGHNTKEYGVVINLNPIMLQGYACNSAAEDNMSTWVISLKKNGKGLTLKLHFEEERRPASNEFGRLFSNLGFKMQSQPANHDDHGNDVHTQNDNHGHTQAGDSHHDPHGNTGGSNNDHAHSTSAHQCTSLESPCFLLRSPSIYPLSMTYFHSRYAYSLKRPTLPL